MTIGSPMAGRYAAASQFACGKCAISPLAVAIQSRSNHARAPSLIIREKTGKFGKFHGPHGWLERLSQQYRRNSAWQILLEQGIV
jgi:hypothetical protein